MSGGASSHEAFAPSFAPANVATSTPLLGSRGSPQVVGEALQAAAPAARRAHGVAHALPAAAVPVDVAVLELHARALGALGDEADLDLTGLGRIRLGLPVRC